MLHAVSFTIAPGEVMGLVGESGCGKSTVGLTLLGYRASNARIESGRVLFKGQDLLSLERSQLDTIRGNRIGFVPQNPTTALNPGMRVGDQMAETLSLHGRAADRAAANARTAELFGFVGLPPTAEYAARYPHQLSGGQQQRVCIAMALACGPDLVVLDEPTTGLDVTTQEQIVALLNDLRETLGMAMLYVTHDLGLLAQLADRIGVMYAGHLVEVTQSRRLFAAPRHPYTQGLIASVPRIDRPAGEGPPPLRGLLRRQDLPAGCAFAPRCDMALERCRVEPQKLLTVESAHHVACWRWPETGLASAASAIPPLPPRLSVGAPLLSIERVSIAYRTRSGILGRLFPGQPFSAVNDLTLDVRRGETFGLVGESGSGKSTVARAISGLLPPSSGKLFFEDTPLQPLVRHRTSEQRRRIQYIFQNPDASLNPRARIGAILARPLEVYAGDCDIPARIREALSNVRLDTAYAERFPDELSGGERQRVAIARALIADPHLLICDEVLSALDVSVQANILELLRALRRERDAAMLFISHDLAVVRSLADRVGVLFRGELMSIGTTEAIFAPPYHPYTLSLLQAVPRIDAPRRPRSPARPGVADLQPKCAYAGRCAHQLGRICIDESPPWQTAGSVKIRCHIPLRQLAALTVSPMDAPERKPVHENHRG